MRNDKFEVILDLIGSKILDDSGYRRTLLFGQVQQLGNSLGRDVHCCDIVALLAEEKCVSPIASPEIQHPCAFWQATTQFDDFGRNRTKWDSAH